MEIPENIIEDDNKNIKDPNSIIKEVKDYEFNQIYIITKEIELKIPLILSYLENAENEIINKITIIKYLISLIKNIPYNLNLILAKKSLIKNLNLYEIIIKEYIYTEENEKDYNKILKNIIIIILRKLSLNKDIYRYILSFLGNFLNEKNHNEKNNNNTFNDYNYNKLLDLLLFFYRSNEDEEIINYFFFNGEKNTNIIINNNNNFLNLDNNLYILLFVKLVDYKYISPLEDNNNKESLFEPNLMEIKFKNIKISIFINIKYKEESHDIINIDNLQNDLNIINIPYNSFKINEINNILVKLNTNMNIEIYINGKEISLPLNLFFENYKYNNIESIQLFNGFYGICSTIMLYKDYKNHLVNIFPNCLIENKKNNKTNNTISKRYEDGFYKEKDFIDFIKADIKNNIEEKNIYDNTINNLSEKNLDEIKNFINNNLISIYTPIRNGEIKSINQEFNIIMLIDSINNFNAYLKNNQLYNNLLFSRSGGVNILLNIIHDFSIDIGGINHLLPLIEVMIDYNELLNNENIENFMHILLTLFSSHKRLIINEKDTKFFYYLSLFLERIPEQYYTNLAANLKSILLSLEIDIFNNNENKIIKVYIKELFEHIFLNEKILFKFKFSDRKIIYEQINKFFMKQKNEQKKMDINVLKIINILLYSEKDKYKYFCCKKHAEYFNKQSYIMHPELNESITPIINIIQLLISQFIIEFNNDDNERNYLGDQLLKILELLTFDITPCLQLNILKLFFGFIKGNDDKYYEFLNKNNIINLTILFLYKTSLFDVKQFAFKFLINLAYKESNKKLNLEQYIEKYATYYYYYPEKEEKETKNINLKKEVYINCLNYHLIEYNESQKKLLSCYDKIHFNDLMNNIFKEAENYYKDKICLSTNLNILLSISSMGSINYILKILKLIDDEFNKNINNIQIIYNNEKIFQWLLDTCYQSYLIKEGIINKSKFIPSFSFGEITNDSEKEKILDKIISLSSNSILNIILNNIYKLDYLLTWSKYYLEIKEIKNGFLSNSQFIFKFFIEKIINKFLDKNNNSDKYIIFKNKLYLSNIVFEYFAFYRFKGFSSDGILINSESLYNQLCKSFINTLNDESIIKRKNQEEDNILLLNDKWEEYLSIKKLLGDWNFFGIKEENLFNYNENIYKYFKEKHNMYNNELKILFNNDTNCDVFEINNNNLCNKGMELIIIKYHYYTLILNAITNHNEFQGILKEISNFIIIIIISSTTLSLDNSKSIINNRKNLKKKIWPNEEEYKNIQEMVKIILFNLFSILNDKIKLMINKIRKYKNKSDKESKIFFKNYNLIRVYLIFIFFYFFKLLNEIYTDVKKPGLSKKILVKNIFNKIKNNSNDKEYIKSTGGFLFIKDFIDNCINEENSKVNAIEKSNSNSFDDFTLIEIKKSFLEDIPSFALNDMHQNDYENSPLNKKLENIYSNYIENNDKIKNYFDNNKEEYQRKLFPFIDYILRRNKAIGKIIPTYDISKYISFDYNYLCLKSNYFSQLPNNIIKMENIPKFNKHLVDELRVFQIELDFNEHERIRGYRKIKKKLFSFNGILSTKKYFYEKNKYICKYKLLNHLTEDYTKLLLTPIIDLNYYLPKFSQFNIKNFFRNENKDHLIQITKIIDLSFKNYKKEDNNEKTNYNGLYLIKEAEYKDMEDLNISIEGTINHYLLFQKYIDKKHKISDNANNSIENSCLIKLSYHIRGFFYNNENEIGFYSYDKIPYKNKKQSNEENINNSKIKEIQKDYDPERKACFGSIFSPQIEKNEYLHLRIPYNQIVFILKRRYYFKVSALEIFTTDKKSYLFKFDHNKLNDIINNLKYYLNQKIEEIYIKNSKSYNKIGFLNLSSKENNMNKKIYEKHYMNLKNIYEKWKEWKISSLRLLMYINIYANRSYNDMNQYPVFPWIITDYESEQFPKINENKLFRPLETPMGMLEISDDSIQRKKDYLDIWALMREENKEDKFDRYGSHYSTALYIAYYLVRIFPFANIGVELQGKSFDDPYRLFKSMKTSFECSSTQKSDLRELIPELFYLPEMLINNNDFHLGEVNENLEKNINSSIKANKIIDDVETPKWCENNPYYFIKKHRELLESYEVSSKINEWINLIFGSKQKGSAGNNVKNLYNSATYEDYEKVYDNLSPSEQCFSCRLLEFGVTPHQIFKYDASQRKINLESKIKQKLLYHTFENIKQNKLNNIELKNNLTFEEVYETFNNATNIYYFQKDKIFESNKKNIYIMNNNNIDIYLRKFLKDAIKNDIKNESIQKDINSSNDEIGYDADDKNAKILEKKETIKLNQFKYGINDKQSIVWLDKGSILAKCGYWNGNIILKNITKEKEKDKDKEKDKTNNINNICYNKENSKTVIYTTGEYSPIMKIVIDSNETFAICGNKEGTITIFKINPNNKLIWKFYKNFNDHNSPITSIAIHENLNIAITCSKAGLCMLYTLPNFKLYNSFIIGKGKKENINKEEKIYPNIVLISDKPLPCFIFYVDLNRCIYFYSINGEFLKKQEFNYSIKENYIKIYTDYQFIDYLIIYNSKNKTFDVYTTVDFTLICSSPVLPDWEFVDYILSKEMDHILILCKIDKYKYKLFILKDSENQISWK